MKNVTLILMVTLMAAYSLHTQAAVLVNPSFETAGNNSMPAYWDGQSGAGVTASSGWGSLSRENWDSPPDGSWAAFLRGTWAGEGDSGGMWQRVSATPDLEYTLSGKFYDNDDFSYSDMYFKLEFYDSTQTFISRVEDDFTGMTEESWVTRSVQGTAPANTAYIQVVFEGWGFGAGGSFGADDFTLTNNGGGSAVPEPSSFLLITAGMVVCTVLRHKKHLHS